MRKNYRDFLWPILVVLIIFAPLILIDVEKSTSQNYIVKQVNQLGDTGYAVCTTSFMSPIFGDVVQGRYHTMVEARYILSIYQRKDEMDSLRKLSDSWTTINGRVE